MGRRGRLGVARAHLVAGTWAGLVEDLGQRPLPLGRLVLQRLHLRAHVDRHGDGRRLVEQRVERRTRDRRVAVEQGKRTAVPLDTALAARTQRDERWVGGIDAARGRLVK